MTEWRNTGLGSRHYVRPTRRVDDVRVCFREEFGSAFPVRAGKLMASRAMIGMERFLPVRGRFACDPDRGELVFELEEDAVAFSVLAA